ncbi:unnamed protein product [Clonostachys rosea]|uniref:Uncharacterized protein n=1 Tax=Bionectria ochroleuca TaxID=29856 RepID=A0ABY6UI98_BIOOC|nr:unnamed protein product [Clonostachys rosea]
MSLDRRGSPKRLPISHRPQDWRIDTLSSRRTCKLGSADSLAIIQRFDREAQIEYTLGRPRLCRLPTVLSLNVFHALARNAATLAVCNEWMMYEAVSPFCRQGPCARGGTGGSGASVTATSLPSSLSCPSALHPTEMQRSVIHHPWIDLFPLPRMRDTILKAIDRGSNVFDEDDLCYDLVDVDKDGLSQKASLIIWGEPWDPQAWEVTEGFLRKWGWLLEGCEEMLEATNYWRRKRGEEPLLIQLPQYHHLV